MNIHLLSGDSLLEEFKKTGIEGEVKVCRECVVDGDLESEGLQDFWEKRAKYLGDGYFGAAKKYEEDVKDEFISLWNLSDDSDSVVNLWFERELFCQANLWFSIWLLRSTEAKFQLVYPHLEDGDSPLKNWSELDTEGLKKSFENRSKVIYDDVFLGVQLWEAFRDNDHETLKKLGARDSNAFPTLKEVCDAAIGLESGAKEAIQRIISEGKTEFGEVFKEFCKREPIYGFGDLQVKRIFDESNE
ncbi:MAG: hypothetical protein HKN25_16585 [Pyrinomonadaceae bacterium]|nr:hypothetical protein [Pyrinomonadaceae bacterium]